MIRKYNNFLLENLIFQLFSVTEDILQGSTDFVFKFKALSKVKGSTGEIAKFILNLIEKEEFFTGRDVKQNYFDLTDKDDKVSFIQPTRIPKDWFEDENPSLPYEMKGRNEIGIGKIVKSILQLASKYYAEYGPSGRTEVPEYKDKDIEEFVNNFKALTSDSKLKFELVSGDDIAKYYNKKKYYGENGSLGSSCMAEESKGTFKLYVQNPRKVKLLILVDSDDKIHGRALVWKLKDSPCEATYFMDRVYTNRDADVMKFRMFADEKGWLQKKVMNSHTESNIDFVYKGKDISGQITCKLDGECKDYPFVDTLCFLSFKDNILSNLPSKKCSVLHSTFGDSDPCDDCNGSLIECNDCYNDDDGFKDCYDCDGSGDTDSGKCVSCKGKGLVKCEHEHGELCNSCCDGVKELIDKKIKFDIGLSEKELKLLVKK